MARVMVKEGHEQWLLQQSTAPAVGTGLHLCVRACLAVLPRVQSRTGTASQLPPTTRVQAVVRQDGARAHRGQLCRHGEQGQPPHEQTWPPSPPRAPERSAGTDPGRD